MLPKVLGPADMRRIPCCPLRWLDESFLSLYIIQQQLWLLLFATNDVQLNSTFYFMFLLCFAILSFYVVIFSTLYIFLSICLCFLYNCQNISRRVCVYRCVCVYARILDVILSARKCASIRHCHRSLLLMVMFVSRRFYFMSFIFIFVCFAFFLLIISSRN